MQNLFYTYIRKLMKKNYFDISFLIILFDYAYNIQYPLDKVIFLNLKSYSLIKLFIYWCYSFFKHRNYFI